MASDLTERYRRERRERARTTREATMALFFGTVVADRYLAERVAVFAAHAAALTGQAQVAAVAAADMYLAEYLRAAPLGIDPAPFLGSTGGTPLRELFARSEGLVRLELVRGRTSSEAIAPALRTVTVLAENETLRAGDRALTDMADRNPRIRGWRRRTGPKPCEICEALADGRVMPWGVAVEAHPRCSCVPEPAMHAGVV